MEARKNSVIANSAITAKTDSGTHCHNCHTPLGVAVGTDTNAILDLLLSDPNMLASERNALQALLRPTVEAGE
jgi:hypothetical protein